MNIAKSIMKYNISCVLLFLCLCLTHLNAYFNDIFARNRVITHPQTGLFLNYIGLYTPAETIIHNSVIFPMTVDACYLLPLTAAANIPSCNITTKRFKRFLPGILCLGIGIASLRSSKSNQIQLKNLQKEMKSVQRSLSNYSNTIKVQEVRLAKLESNQIILTHELQLTQQTLGAILNILNSHSKTLIPLKAEIERLHHQFQYSSLHLAIDQIFRNDLTLNFLSSEDLKKVVYDIIDRGNITFNSDHGAIPVIQIITKLLVQQQIDFIPRVRYSTENSAEIGRLVITNFFAIPKQNQIPFQVYKLLSVPFVHNNETIELTNIPRYWAINPGNNTTMEWYDRTESGCELEFVLSCRDTPPIQKLAHDTCLGQIIESILPTRCQTTVTSISSVFVRQLRDNLWINSSSEPLDCFRLSKTEYLNTVEESFNSSQHLSLPSVALINVTAGQVIACPRFTLIGRPIASNASSLVILYNNSFFTNNNNSIVDIYHHLKVNTAWLDRKPFKLGEDGIIYII